MKASTLFLLSAYCIVLGFTSNLNWYYSKNNTTLNDTLTSTCFQAPLWNLNICNKTCHTCLSNDPYKCTACEDQFQFSSQSCHLDNNIHSYVYTGFLRDLDYTTNKKDIKNLKFMDTGAYLNKSNMVSVCKKDTYQFFMAGLFKSTDKVGFSVSYIDKVDRITVKFNLLSVIQDLTIFVAIGEDVIYTQKFTYLSDLKGDYIASDTEATSYLSLDALTSNNAQSIIVPINTGAVTLITNTIDLNIYITTSSNQQFTWGFNDLILVTRSCQTCVTVAVTNVINSLTNLTGFTAIVVVILIVLLFVMIKLEEIKRKRDFQQKLGSASGNLPLKAINRVLDNLQKFRKGREKEWAKEDRLFKKLTKKS